MTAATINAHLAAGGKVVVGTYTRATLYGPKHVGYFVDKADGIYVRSGKRFLYLGPEAKYVGVRFSVLP